MATKGRNWRENRNTVRNCVTIGDLKQFARDNKLPDDALLVSDDALLVSDGERVTGAYPHKLPNGVWTIRLETKED